MSPRDITAYIFLALTWGSSFLVAIHAIHAFGWGATVAFRCLIAGVVLLAGAKLAGRRLDFSFGFKPLVFVGLTTVVLQLVGLLYGLPLIGTAMSAIIVTTIPIFSMLVARIFGIEPITTGAALGIALGVVGVVMLVGFPSQPITTDFILGSLASLISTFSAAVGSVYVGHKLKDAGVIEVTAGSFLIGGVVCLPLLFVVPIPAWPAPVDYLYLLILGAVMSGFTYVIYFALLTSIGPTRAVSVEFAVTGVAVLIGTLLLGETLSPLQIVGTAAIGLGCAMVLGLHKVTRAEAIAEHPGA